ncbi:50S ribosomal protein L18 [Geothermobacter hydrogeniphilus]|uniref:Large ribosomal subunit protein uL18 n=1 Tax=Geothermobacter hydrogeniphilus TaxID=1969733 RepID=A0A1X0YCY7_9BACT|nr:50S ribosomal protein L18 [Geothermobacter hydrogeniphilus]ORJ63080.1 50S ribosomal protein L18 [Geothermobacter hydrogeniphilus]
MNNAEKRRQSRLKRQVRVRNKVRGTAERPRLSVFRSARHIYVQVIDDVNNRTLVSASTVNKDVGAELQGTGNVDAAKAVGVAIAKRAIAQDIKQVVFDRNGFLYHGRVKALADAAREAGLSF